MPDRISHETMALRVARELGPGQVVSLGAGLPSLVPGCIAPEWGGVFFAENGVVGYGPTSWPGGAEEDLVGPRGEPVSLIPGSAIVHQADSFGIIRGGYIDVAIVEPLQVSARGDLVDPTAHLGRPAIPSASVDITSRATYLIAMMEHTTQDGRARIVTECSDPIVSGRRINLIVTDVAVMQVTGEGLRVMEVAPGWTLEAVQAITEAPFVPAQGLKEMEFSQPAQDTVNKLYPDGASAVADIPDGAVVLLDGFAGPGGMAQYLLVALRDQGAKDLAIVSNTAGIARAVNFGTPPGYLAIDHSLLVDNRQVAKAVASFPVSPSPSRPSSFELAYSRGEVELELVPQGTLAERIRAGGYGIAAFYTPTGAGTQIAQGKGTRLIDGREYVLEHAIKGDYALIRAHVADKMGNLVYKGTSRNFNAVMAPAAAITIAEVDEIVEVGELDPDAIVTPGVFVQRIVRRPPGFQPYEVIA